MAYNILGHVSIRSSSRVAGEAMELDRKASIKLALSKQHFKKNSLSDRGKLGSRRKIHSIEIHYDRIARRKTGVAV